ncbi:PPOX class probable F420-dependent enzyme, Rv0121 family [Amycolatopsis arida]|uniref:PPOX class probable F420-dependent enzyme, Rv0121 family n=1 Tax=Amycolatopsis arida TaxID=587909 RepID=A0A1I5ZEI0_9PSEU|nr:TIGR03668 family PPOX class F420-dependent oxidoreductase [Amycolatopsis arida]TDX89583.1 PPOX class probable F420-dependent enzyme [Amycolatopsis arida]SFQ54831.1 PPOX class probable F420-dependent enzyme, Rv0121 family [Amycolatopsis arida]
MRLHPREARRRFAAARVARLATVGPGGVPHLVPVTFAVLDDAIVFAVDHKPKSSVELRRLRNIAANPAVSFLVDHYDDDWTRLWWTRADGTATTVHDPERRRAAVDALAARYPQYAARPPTGAVVRTDVTHWSGWTAGG